MTQQTTQQPIHPSIVQRACDALLWHPECPPMPEGTEGLAFAMEAALQAVREDLAESSS
jgi:hypothetical protein